MPTTQRLHAIGIEDFPQTPALPPVRMVYANEITARRPDGTPVIDYDTLDLIDDDLAGVELCIDVEYTDAHPDFWQSDPTQSPTLALARSCVLKAREMGRRCQNAEARQALSFYNLLHRPHYHGLSTATYEAAVRGGYAALKEMGAAANSAFVCFDFYRKGEDYDRYWRDFAGHNIRMARWWGLPLRVLLSPIRMLPNTYGAWTWLPDGMYQDDVAHVRSLLEPDDAVVDWLPGRIQMDEAGERWEVVRWESVRATDFARALPGVSPAPGDDN